MIDSKEINWSSTELIDCLAHCLTMKSDDAVCVQLGAFCLFIVGVGGHRLNTSQDRKTVQWFTETVHVFVSRSRSCVSKTVQTQKKSKYKPGLNLYQAK